MFVGLFLVSALVKFFFSICLLIIPVQSRVPVWVLYHGLIWVLDHG